MLPDLHADYILWGASVVTAPYLLANVHESICWHAHEHLSLVFVPPCLQVRETTLVALLSYILANTRASCGVDVVILPLTG